MRQAAKSPGVVWRALEWTAVMIGLAWLFVYGWGLSVFSSRRRLGAS